MKHSKSKTQASSIYQQGLLNVANKPEPKKQKFPCGSRVKIARDLGPHMSHFPNDILATVKYTHAHAYGGNDVKSYSLIVDGMGEHCWYEEQQLEAV